ncbi:hypothetical protein BO443_80070 [Burkholderia orbicola]
MSNSARRPQFMLGTECIRAAVKTLEPAENQGHIETRSIGRQPLPQKAQEHLRLCAASK